MAGHTKTELERRRAGDAEAAPAPAPAPAEADLRVLALQRAVGNRAVTAMLARNDGKDDKGKGPATEQPGAEPQREAVELAGRPETTTGETITLSEALLALAYPARKVGQGLGALFDAGPKDKRPIPDASLWGQNDTVEPSDVQQGRLGDCYLLAALMAVAAVRPDWIRQMVTEVPGEPGEYLVTIWEDKSHWFDKRFAPRQVKVSSDFQTRGDGAGTRGAEPSDAMALWPLLIEKAYAKTRGSYRYTGWGGTMHHALETVTGMEATVLETDAHSPDALLAQLRAMQDAKKAVVAGTRRDWAWPGRTAFEEEMQRLGLVPGHAYAVRVAITGHIVVRNPWGHTMVREPGQKRLVREATAERFLTPEQFKRFFGRVAADKPPEAVVEPVPAAAAGTG